MPGARPLASLSAMIPGDGRCERTAGELLRDWRRRRRLSQLALATEAEVSQRHLSFVECGRASPSRAMLLHLAEHLAVPLRERNALLTSAGFAPVYRERPLDDAEMAGVRETIGTLLDAHAPAPALAVDRHWNLLLANDCVGPLIDGAAAHLLEPPINVLRLGLHPEGLAPRIANLRQWREHLLRRLARQVDGSNDAGLIALLEELRAYPAPPPGRDAADGDQAGDQAGDRAGDRTGDGTGTGTGIAVPLHLRVAGRSLALVSTTMVFGTPLDVTLSELAVETFFPADRATAEALRSLRRDAARPGGRTRPVR